MRFCTHRVAHVRRQLGEPGVFLERPLRGVGLVRFVVGRSAVTLRIHAWLDLKRAGRLALIGCLRTGARTGFAGGRRRGAAEVRRRLLALSRLFALARLVPLTWLVALAGFGSLSGFLALAESLCCFGIRLRAGNLLGRGLGRTGNDPRTERFGLSLTAVFALAGFMSLAGFRRGRAADPRPSAAVFDRRAARRPRVLRGSACSPLPLGPRPARRSRRFAAGLERSGSRRSVEPEPPPAEQATA